MSTEAPRNENGLTEDELWSTLDGQVGAERASTLIDLAHMANGREEHEQALSLADAAVEAASENEQTLAQAHVTKGVALFGLERFEESAASHLDAARLFERYDSVSSISMAYFNASWSLEMAGLFERALQCAESAIAASSQADEELPLAHSHEQRADVLEKLGRPTTEVVEALSAARQAYRSVGDARAVLRCDDRVAGIFADNGDHKAAVSLLTDCLAVAESLDEERAAYFSYRLGKALRLQGRFDEALEALQRPLAYNLAQDEMHALGATYYEMAICEWRRDNVDEAFRLISRARAHFDVVGSDGGVNDCDDARSSWLHGVGRFNEAADVNRNLLEVTKGWMRFMARARLADNLRAEGDLTSALAFAEPQPDEDEEWVGRSGWFWRENVRARVLAAMDRADDARALAAHCLAMDTSAASAFVRGSFHELRGDAKSATGDEEGAHDDWARAVALYLMADLPEAAKRLSEAFLPKPQEESVQ